MRFTLLIPILAGLAYAKPTDRLARALDRSKHQLGQGLSLLADSANPKLDRAKRDSALRRAKSHMRRARIVAKSAVLRAGKEPGMKQALGAAQTEATDALVDVLNHETENYLARGKTSLASSRNAEAFRLDPNDTRVKALRAEIAKARARRPGREGGSSRSGESNGGGNGFNERRRSLYNTLGLGHRLRSNNRTRGSGSRGGGGGGRR